MIRFFTNRQMASRLGINLPRWKRWSREFLPPDPLGGLQSGLARQYSVFEAFSVYLGGHLVASLNFSIPEARRILSDLQPHFSRLGIPGSAGRQKTPAHVCPDEITAHHVRIWRLPAAGPEPVRFGYLLRQRLQNVDRRNENPPVREERMLETPIGEHQPEPPAEEPMSWRTLNIGSLHQWFSERTSTPVV